MSTSGLGAHAPDGSPVELYQQLPYLGELEDLADALAAHGAVLELGCGTGRLCRRLLELGLAVAGVDESADMLLRVPSGVETFQGRIEELRLPDRRWPAVLLPSHLINHADDEARRGFVRCARRHVAPDGRFYLQAHDAQWLATVASGPIGSAGGVAMAAEAVRRDGDRVAMTVRYDGFGQTWRRAFTAVVLSESQIEALLVEEGFDDVRWLGPRRRWVSARLSPPAP
jgi:SAM-dependent methyltransferase